MADIILDITLKDVEGNLSRVIDNVDNIFPGRKGDTKKIWIEKEIKKFLITSIRNWEKLKAHEKAIEEENSKNDPIIETGTYISGK